MFLCVNLILKSFALKSLANLSLGKTNQLKAKLTMQDWLNLKRLRFAYGF
jgi:hypothetical protein